MQGLTAEEAEMVVQGRTSRDSNVDRMLYDRGAELATAVERATGFLTVDGGGSGSLAAVYLSGGGARIPRLEEAVADRLRVRLEVVNPLQRLDVDPEAIADVPGEDAAPMWMLPIGLSLRAPS